MAGAVDKPTEVVERWLDAIERRRFDVMMRLAAPDMAIRLPDGSERRGRLDIYRLLAWLSWRARFSLRTRPLAIEPAGGEAVTARTRNTARRGRDRLDLEMTVRFRVRDGRIAAMDERTRELDAWRRFWRRG